MQRHGKVVVLAAVIALLAGCGSDSGTEEADELNIALSNLGNESMDPAATPGDSAVYLQLIYDSLFGSDKEGLTYDRSTGLAAEWSSSSDDRALEITLRDDVTFHNGTPLTAHDVKFSLERLFAPTASSPYASAIRSVIGEPENIIVEDDHRLRVETVKPTFQLVFALSSLATASEGAILSEAYFDEVGEAAALSTPIGTGPYRFVSQTSGSRIELAAYHDYFNEAARPRFEEVSISLVPELTTRVAMLQTGQANMVDVTPEVTEEVSGSGFTVAYKALPDVTYLYYHLYQDEPPLNDERVRAALNLAIDREAINDAYFDGEGLVVGNTFSIGSVGVGEDTEAWPFDPEEARRQLADAGYEDGLRLTMQTFPKAGWPVRQLAEAIASAWSEVGVEAEIIYRDYGSYRTEFVERDSDGNKVGLPPGTVTLHPNAGRYDGWGYSVQSFSTSDGVLSVVADPELDDMVEDLISASTLDEYAEILEAVDDYHQSENIFSTVLQYSMPFAHDAQLDGWSIGRASYGLNLRSTLLTWD